MRIKLDENMPVLLIRPLELLGHDVDSVASEGLQGRDDDTIRAAAQDAGRFLVTQDMDFSDLRKIQSGKDCGVLVLRLQEPGLPAIAKRLMVVFKTEDVEHWAGCLVIVSDQ